MSVFIKYLIISQNKLMYAFGIFPDCIVLGNDVYPKEVKKTDSEGKEIKVIVEERTLSVNQRGSKQNLKVIVPLDSTYEIHGVYDFEGVITSGLYNGKEWAKLTVKAK